MLNLVKKVGEVLLLKFPPVSYILFAVFNEDRTLPDHLRLLAFSFEDMLNCFMDQLVGVLGKFRVVDLLEPFKGELKGIDLLLKLGHQLLGVSRLLELKDFVIHLDSFLFFLDFLFLTNVPFIRSFLSHVLVHQVLAVHLTITYIILSLLSI